MSLLNELTKTFAGEALSNLSGQLGIDEGIASKAIAAALPMIVGAMAKNATKQGGADALASAIDKDHDGSILDNLGSFLGSKDNGPGAGILKHVFGNNRGLIEAGLSQVSGLDQGKTGSLLENLAPVIMGQLGKQKSQQGLDSGGLADLLGGAVQQSRGAGGSGALDMLGSILDQDGDGNLMDDVGGLLGKFLK